MRVPLEVEKEIERQKIAAYVVGHLPIIKSYAVKIGLVDIINELVPSKMEVDPGTIFLGMVMDTLSGRTPLYRLDEFFQPTFGFVWNCLEIFDLDGHNLGTI